MSGLPPTEGHDPASAHIDALDDAALARALIETHRGAVDAAAGAAASVADAIALVADVLAGGGRVVTFGAGTSGRLGVLDASELPPTFGWDPARWEGRIAGGDAALRRAIEGAEDDAEAGRRDAAGLGSCDAAIGVSASGGAPYVRAALAEARSNGARTIALVNAPGAPLLDAAEVAIVVPTGPEPVTGSTRLRAGSAQKIVLNAISTGAMIRLGKTYGNRMVDVVATNAKLRDRAVRLVREIAGDVDAAALLRDAGGSVKVAAVMARRGVKRAEAEVLLAAAGGRLAVVIGAPA